MTVSVLGPGGYPKELYGSFAGKVFAKPVVSILGPGGYPKAPYGTFAGKPFSPVVVSFLSPTPFSSHHNFGKQGSS